MVVDIPYERNVLRWLYLVWYLLTTSSSDGKDECLGEETAVSHVGDYAILWYDSVERVET